MKDEFYSLLSSIVIIDQSKRLIISVGDGDVGDDRSIVIMMGDDGGNWDDGEKGGGITMVE